MAKYNVRSTAFIRYAAVRVNQDVICDPSSVLAPSSDARSP